MVHLATKVAYPATLMIPREYIKLKCNFFLRQNIHVGCMAECQNEFKAQKFPLNSIQNGKFCNSDNSASVT
jgi:hypothetical protein